MAFLAPYHDAMKLGSGFNSFTQELCLDGAVIREETGVVKKNDPQAIEVEEKPTRVAQSVTYKTSIIDKVSDVFDTLNINAAFTVKFGKGSVEGGADFLNVSKIKNSDLTFMGLKPADFPRVYGDSFISGFQEGGEFTAIISIRAMDRTQANSIKADAAVGLTLEKASGDIGFNLDKIKRELLTENETTISVAWTGGGQGLKKPQDDWTFDTMKAAALKFPDLVAQCPMRTHAVLTKYTSLKSFHTTSIVFNPLSYENARVYTSALRDAFLDFQNISKSLAVLALDINSGTYRLVSQQEKLEKDFGKKTLKASDPSLLENIMNETQVDSMKKTLDSKSSTDAKTTGEGSDILPNAVPKAAVVPSPRSDTASDDAIVVDKTGSGDVPKNDNALEEDKSKAVERQSPPKSANPLIIDQPYPPTLHGLESARMQCRFMMNRIVAEVDKVASYPEIATDENRPLPYMSPFLFNMLLPVGIPVV